MSNEATNLITADWMDACPAGVLALDERRVLWASPALARLIGRSADRLPGQSRERPDADLRPLLAEDGLVGLGLGDGTERWLRCTSSRVPGPDGGTLELRFFQDATREVQLTRERDALVRQVKELNLTDALTGLANRRALGNALTAQVTRSRRYHNPLTIVLCRVRLPGSETPVPEGVVLSVSRFLRDRLRWADTIGRFEPDCFLLILPETDLTSAAELMRDIQQEAGDLTLPPPHEGLALRLDMGVAQWVKGLDQGRLIAAAREALEVDAEAGVAQSS